MIALLQRCRAERARSGPADLIHLKAGAIGRLQTFFHPMEVRMTTNEMYYLILVLGAFSLFAVSLSTASLRYRRVRAKQR